MLIGEDQHRVCRKRVLDGREIGRIDRPRQVDIADFGGKARRNRNDGDGQDPVLRAWAFRWTELDHSRAADAIGSAPRWNGPEARAAFTMGAAPISLLSSIPAYL